MAIEPGISNIHCRIYQPPKSSMQSGRAKTHSWVLEYELEWVKNEILANIWLTNRIARIDPVTGKVKGWIDVGLLPEAMHRTDPNQIPNGIAYDAEHDRLFITGKDWPHLYEIKIDAKPVR